MKGSLLAVFVCSVLLAVVFAEPQHHPESLDQMNIDPDLEVRERSDVSFETQKATEKKQVAVEGPNKDRHPRGHRHRHVQSARGAVKNEQREQKGQREQGGKLTTAAGATTEATTEASPGLLSLVVKFLLSVVNGVKSVVRGIFYFFYYIIYNIFKAISMLKGAIGWLVFLAFIGAVLAVVFLVHNFHPFLPSFDQVQKTLHLV